MTDSLDRLQGARSTLGMKTPVRVATTADITLSGLQAIDGVTVAEDDRVLVKDQSDLTENGVYGASTGAWSRTKDFDSGTDFVRGTTVVAAQGTLNVGRIYRVSSADITTIGEDDIEFEAFDFDANANGSAISGPTLDLDAVDGDVVDVSGAGTITAITLSESVTKLVRFTGAATLTHSATLGLPGSQDIVCIAGDWAMFRGYASSVVRCVFFERSTSQPLITGTATIASAATVDLGAVREQLISLTGSTTVTSFGTSAQTGATKFVTLAGAIQLTHSANLICAGLGDIQGESGDSFIAQYEGSSVWRVVNYRRATKYADWSNTQVSNSATTESDLKSYTLPANQLGTKNVVRVTAWGVNSASTVAAVRMRLYFGATPIADTGALAAIGQLRWKLEGTVAYGGGLSIQDAIGSAEFSTGITGVSSRTMARTFPAEPTTGAVTIKVTGLATAGTGIITQTGMLVERLMV